MRPKRWDRIRNGARGSRLRGRVRPAIVRALRHAHEACADLERCLHERTAELEAAKRELRSEALARRAAERQVAIYAEAIRVTGEAVAVADASRTLIEVNPAYEDAMGRSREELIGRPLCPIEPGKEAEALRRELWRSVEANGRWAGEVGDSLGGDSFLSRVEIRTLRDEAGAASHYVCVSRNITALKRSEEQLQRLAFYDNLTQLPNRALLNDRLRVALASAERRRDLIAIMYLDLDGFKEVNDTLGHAAGDALLVETGRRIGRCIRASDTLARTGGDEFTVLLTRAGSIADAIVIAERILEAVAEPTQVAGRTVHVGTSIGISFYPRDGEDAETLQLKADLAMYKAKKAGRGQYRVFEGELVAPGKDRLSLTAQLEAALAAEELVLFYQPIVDAATATVQRAEALLRWRKPGGELALPDAFLPHAHECGLIRRIDPWVLERACRDARNWPGEAARPGVCVNLSAASIQQPNLARLVSDVLQRTGLEPRRLHLEVTEGAIVRDPQAARRALEEVAALGVDWSLDDFGTGHSSLAYLTRFPIRGVKLDRALVERIGRDVAGEELIRTALTLARRLDLDVVAKGVEHSHQQAFLSALGCRLVQGYRFVRPMAGDMFPAWLASNGARGLKKVTRLARDSGASGKSAS